MRTIEAELSGMGGETTGRQTVEIFPATGPIAGPAAAAKAALDAFIASYNAGTDLEAIVGLFARDVQFWGTTKADYGTTIDTVRAYFAASLKRRGSEVVKAEVVQASALVIGAEMVLVTGRWQATTGGTTRPLRFSMALARRGSGWEIVQFQSSERPGG
jgi:hypothetical protein